MEIPSLGFGFKTGTAYIRIHIFFRLQLFITSVLQAFCDCYNDFIDGFHFMTTP